jgi:hypothetical protein
MAEHATDILLQAIRSVLGPSSDVARNLIKAVESENMLDMMLAHSSFDDLSAELRRKIAEEVDRAVTTVLKARGGT